MKFSRHVFRDFEVRIFRDTLISRFCENFAFRLSLISRFWVRHTLFLCQWYLTCPWIWSNNLINNVQINRNATDYVNSNKKDVLSVYKAIELVEQHYKEPVNGQFEDCTKEVLPGVETESRSDEEDLNITTE